MSEEKQNFSDILSILSDLQTEPQEGEPAPDAQMTSARRHVSRTVRLSQTDSTENPDTDLSRLVEKIEQDDRAALVKSEAEGQPAETPETEEILLPAEETAEPIAAAAETDAGEPGTEDAESPAVAAEPTTADLSDLVIENGRKPAARTEDDLSITQEIDQILSEADARVPKRAVPMTGIPTITVFQDTQKKIPAADIEKISSQAARSASSAEERRPETAEMDLVNLRAEYPSAPTGSAKLQPEAAENDPDAAAYESFAALKNGKTSRGRIAFRVLLSVFCAVVVGVIAFYSISVRYAHGPLSVRAEWIRSCRESSMTAWIPSFFLDDGVIENTEQQIIAQKGAGK